MRSTVSSHGLSRCVGCGVFAHLGVVEHFDGHRQTTAMASVHLGERALPEELSTFDLMRGDLGRTGAEVLEKRKTMSSVGPAALPSTSPPEEENGDLPKGSSSGDSLGKQKSEEETRTHTSGWQHSLCCHGKGFTRTTAPDDGAKKTRSTTSQAAQPSLQASPTTQGVHKPG
jgi:hypothetical protein